MFIITMLFSVVVTMLLLGLIAVPPHVVLSVLGSFLAVWYLAKDIAGKIREKSMPVVSEWCQYAFLLAGIVLYAAGMYYRSTYVVIAAFVCVVGFVISYYVEKRTKEVE